MSTGAASAGKMAASTPRVSAPSDWRNAGSTSKVVVERVEDHGERDVELELGGAASERGSPARPPAVRQLHEQTGLADTGLPDDLQRPRGVGRQAVEREIELGDFARAAKPAARWGFDDARSRPRIPSRRGYLRGLGRGQTRKSGNGWGRFRDWHGVGPDPGSDRRIRTLRGDAGRSARR